MQRPYTEVSMTDNSTRRAALVLVIVGALAVLLMSLGSMGPGPMTEGGGMWGAGMWGGGPVPGWLLAAGVVMQVLSLVALVGGGYLVYRAATGDGRDPDGSLEELRLAYARGDLTDEEYEQRRERLERDT
jgi:putative membrane protein